MTHEFGDHGLSGVVVARRRLLRDVTKVGSKGRRVEHHPRHEAHLHVQEVRRQGLVHQRGALGQQVMSGGGRTVHAEEGQPGTARNSQLTQCEG